MTFLEYIFCFLFSAGYFLTIQEHQEPEGWTRVPVMAQGAKALEVRKHPLGTSIFMGI